MATTVGDLLDTAQTCLCRAAEPLPAADDGRGGGVRAALGRLEAAWPQFAAAASRAVDGLRPDISSSYNVVGDRLNEAIDRGQRADIDARAANPQLHRAALLMGAAADAADITGRRNPARDSGPVDRVLAIVETAATLTALYTEHAHPFAGDEGWADLARAAREANRSAPYHPSTAATRSAVPGVHDRSLVATLARWDRAAHHASRVTPHPSADLPLLANGLSALHATAAIIDPGAQELASRAAQWRTLVAAFRPALRIPGPIDLELREASAELSVALRRVVHQPVLSGRARDRDLLRDYLDWEGPSLSRHAAAAIIRAVRSSLLISPLGSIVAHSERPVPADLAFTTPAARRQWVPVPPSAAIARDLEQAAAAAGSVTIKPPPTSAHRAGSQGPAPTLPPRPAPAARRHRYGRRPTGSPTP